MRAMKLIEPGEPLQLLEVSTPRPKGSSVLIRVEACGVCHTDIHLNAGFYDLGEGRKLTLKDRGIELPRTLGHEIAGRVEEIGEGAKTSRIKRGDSVVVYPWIGCGSCRNCGAGMDNMCEGRPRTLGIFADGGYAEEILVPDARFLVPLAGITTAQAAPLACSGITSLSALKKSGVVEDSLLVVIGAGGLGSTAIQLAKRTVRARVAALDVHDTQLELASKLGADYTLNTRGLSAEAISSSIRGFNGGRSADAVIDFVGSSDTFSAAFQMLGKRGRLVSIGLFGGSAQFPLPILAQRGIEIIGNYTGSLADLSELVRLVKEGSVNPVVSETFRLEDVNLALEKLRRGEVKGRILTSPAP
jgi:D-arabinose 1-dehydrogenase-like Zn-dependent alcohol dehydrogenase